MTNEFKLRDISEFGELKSTDLKYLQAKISAAGEMKTAIKRYLDAHPENKCSHTKKLKKTMEDYLNVQQWSLSSGINLDS